MNESTALRTKLYVEFPPAGPDDHSGEASLATADGLVINVARCATPEAVNTEAPPTALICSDPERHAAWRSLQGLVWVCAGGLEQAARLRDEWPEQLWLPRLTVYKPSVIYRFSNEFDGEGFKFYRPDTGAIRGYRVTDGDVPLKVALDRAKELAFEKLWLYAADAEILASGLDLEMLERARADWQGELWLSGGAADPRHLANLVREGGVAAVVVPAMVANRCGCATLQAALEPSRPPTPAESPIRFAERNAASSS